MATEQFSKPSSLPPYPQMIMEAIESLKQSDGAEKSTISNYMESKYGEMPPGHSDLLTTHLARMKGSGELLFIKNNYLKPGGDTPAKRGRGRPPKPKEHLPSEVIPCPSLPRGRPRKDPNAPSAIKKSKPSSAPPPPPPPPPVFPRRGGQGEGQERIHILCRMLLKPERTWERAR